MPPLPIVNWALGREQAVQPVAEQAAKPAEERAAEPAPRPHSFPASAWAPSQHAACAIEAALAFSGFDGSVCVGAGFWGRYLTGSCLRRGSCNRRWLRLRRSRLAAMRQHIPASRGSGHKKNQRKQSAPVSCSAVWPGLAGLAGIGGGAWLLGGCAAVG